jgi:hypothetical protein
MKKNVIFRTLEIDDTEVDILGPFWLMGQEGVAGRVGTPASPTSLSYPRFTHSPLLPRFPHSPLLPYDPERL